jgi:hypothetical protein
VTDGAQHHSDEPGTIEIVIQLACLVDHHQRVHPDVPLGMPFGLLLAPDERLHLRQDLVDDAEIQRERKTDRGPFGGEQQFLQLPPDALRRQIVERNPAAQVGCVVLQRELESRRKLDGTKHTKAVVAKRRGIHDTQNTTTDVVAPVERVLVDVGQRIPGDRVDGEVAAACRVLDRHGGIADDLEAFVSPA